MRRHHSRLLTFAAAIIAAAGGLVGTGAPAAQAATGIDWAPCAENDALDCGAVTVPVDWADPAGPTIGIAVARHRASDPAARVGSLVINPGGPGGSGVGSVLGSTFEGDLARRFDIVGFDPRGVARSAPILCSLDRINALPSSRITDQAHFDTMVSVSRALADDCRARTGPVFDHVDTGQTVRDIDAVRAALGEPKLTFFGMSYGTLMAQQYAETFPGRVRAIVSDSNMDHSVDTSSWFATEATALQDMFQAFVAGCGRISSCVLSGRDIPRFWARLLDRAARGELPDPDAPGTQVTQSELVGLVEQYLMYDAYFLPLAETLRNLDEGRPSSRTLRVTADAVAEQAAELSPAAAIGTPAAALTQAASDEPPTVVNFSYQAIFCQDWNLPVADAKAWSKLAARAKAAAPDFPFVPRAESPPAICLGWNGAVNNPQHRLSARPATPLLLVNSRHDVATGYVWATAAAAQLGRGAVLLTYDGVGHIAYGRTACVDDAIIGYLSTQLLPPAGKHCASAPVPGTEDASVVESARRSEVGGELSAARRG